MSNVPHPANAAAAVDPAGGDAAHRSAPEPLSRIDALLAEPVAAAPEVRQTYGVVEGREGERFLVRAGAELARAVRAKSCLIEPSAGDTVLLSRSSDDRAFVLAVLVGRAEDAERVIDVDGDLTLRSKTGRVAIVGNDGVAITSGNDLSVNAPSVTARTMKASLFADSLSYLGRTVDAQLDRVKVLGQSLETVIDHVSSRVKHSFRTIDELERVKAKELHVRAEATLNMHGKNTVMTAEKLVKFDGEQISIG